MIPLLLDQGRAAADLRDHGWDAVHVGDLGMSAASDIDILNLARSQGRAVVTLDSDFAKILARLASTKPSIVHLRIEGLDRAAAGRLLKTVLPTILSDLERGVIASVTTSESRVRRLPLV